MAVIKSYPQGVPSWVDLATENPEGAKKFYTRLFGWDFDDFPIPDGDGAYTMYKRQGEYVAGSVKHNPVNGPPHWQIYFSVDDVDAVTKTVGGLGGTIVDGPFDVMDYGRVSVIQDPQGAVCMLWQAKNHIGAGRQGEPGSPCWFELMTNDATGAVAFYCGLLKSGTTSEQMPGAPSEYHLLRVAGVERAGIMQIGTEMGDMPTAWGVYFGVEKLDASMALIKEMGGTVTFGPMDIPDGKMASACDPDGVAFSLFMRT